jgi:serine/threonine protein kinase
MESLQTKILENIETCPLDDRGFLQQSSLDESITAESIGAELRQAELSPTLSDQIFESAQKIFTILVYIDMVQAIEDLLQEGFTDKYLPVDLESHAVMKSENGEKKFEWFGCKPWTSRKAKEFFDEQWLVQSPVFKGDGQYVLNKRCPLPFIEFISDIVEGHFSDIHKVKIHYAHELVSRPSPVSIVQALKRSFRAKDIKVKGGEPFIAIKRLKSNDVAAYSRELETLNAIKGLGHPHLIKLIAAYRRGRRCCFIFPWADGNLREFWEREDRKPLNAESMMWAFQQMRGLTDALSALHNFSAESGEDQFCRHGDLKPENILLFKEREDDKRGKLLIADVGLAKFHNERTRDRKGATSTASGTRPYEPPDVDLDRKGKRSRKYDTWSMGCIFLEFTIWLLSGTKEVERFKADREVSNHVGKKTYRFYEVTHWENGEASAAAIHPAVNSWMEKMYEDRRCTGDTAFKDLLTLIKDDLLQIKVDDRGYGAELYEKLSEIVKRAEREPSYLFNGADAPPRTALLGPPSPSRDSRRDAGQVPRQATLGVGLNPAAGPSLGPAGDDEHETPDGVIVRVSPPDNKENGPNVSGSPVVRGTTATGK